MRIEHFALNVPDPVKMADWYVENLGFKIVLATDEAPFVRFLADGYGGRIEIYNNPAGDVLDFNNTHPLTVHLAFVSEDPNADRAKLEAVGATFVEEVNLPDGGLLVMMKDPWGVAIQFCKRGTPFEM